MNALAPMAALLVLLGPLRAFAAEPVAILAAENVYGDVARQIGGPEVTATSILKNPDQDPHLFEVSPSVARAVSAARIVVYNGLDYDPWMARLLHAAPRRERVTIVVGDLALRHTGDNPHIWYDVDAVLRLAAALSGDLARIDPAHASGYQSRLAAFRASMQPVQDGIAALHDRLAGTPVTATEPVFGYMFHALGMQVRNMGFQLAVMNDTEPSASDIAGMESDLRQHRVRMLLYNSQASDPMAERMMQLAKAAHVPVVGATETEPPDTQYQAWMLNELGAVSRALPK